MFSGTGKDRPGNDIPGVSTRLPEQPHRVVQQLAVARFTVPGNDHPHLRIRLLHRLHRARPGRNVRIAQIALARLQLLDQAATEQHVFTGEVADHVVLGVPFTMEGRRDGLRPDLQRKRLRETVLGHGHAVRTGELDGAVVRVGRDPVRVEGLQTAQAVVVEVGGDHGGDPALQAVLHPADQFRRAGVVGRRIEHKGLSATAHHQAVARDIPEVLGPLEGGVDEGVRGKLLHAEHAGPVDLLRHEVGDRRSATGCEHHAYGQGHLLERFHGRASGLEGTKIRIGR